MRLICYATSMFNDLTSLSSYFASRRSGRPAEMVAPGPDTQALTAMIEMALRTPDHGKLAPWRFIIINDERRDDFKALLTHAFLVDHPNASDNQIETGCKMAHYAPSLVVMIYSPKESKIPEFEQVLSAGAAAMNFLHAAHIAGYVGSWITGWPAYDETIRQEFCESDEKIAGFFYVGTAGAEQLERPRPNADDHIMHW